VQSYFHPVSKSGTTQYFYSGGFGEFRRIYYAYRVKKPHSAYFKAMHHSAPTPLVNQDKEKWFTS